MYKSLKKGNNIFREENMKKNIISLILVCLFLLSGCDDINNTPTKQVESFFNKYQTLDQEVLDDLDRVISEEEAFNTIAREGYREVIKEQYKSLTYEIKEEFMDGDEATVTVDITVTDFVKVLNEARVYKITNISEFQDEDGDYDVIKYSNYVIEQLKDAKDKVTYTVELELTKIDDKWHLDSLDEDTEDKILGIYQY